MKDGLMTSRDRLCLLLMEVIFIRQIVITESLHGRTIGLIQSKARRNLHVLFNKKWAGDSAPTRTSPAYLESYLES